MATQSEVLAAGATLFYVGLSALIKVAPAPFTFGMYLKNVAGGGTLELAPIPNGYSLSGSGCTGWGGGYPIAAGETIALDGPATFYLAASGATMTVALVMGKTAGASYI